MSLSSFLLETVVTKTGVVKLNEGIQHIEALPVRDFINAIENVANFTASEKLDGSNLTFGFENNGRYYTSREAKGGKRFYTESDFSDRPPSRHTAMHHQPVRSAYYRATGDRT